MLVDTVASAAGAAAKLVLFLQLGPELHLQKNCCAASLGSTGYGAAFMLLQPPLLSVAAFCSKVVFFIFKALLFLLQGSTEQSFGFLLVWLLKLVHHLKAVAD